ncbi:uncharacterized protein LOC121683545 isoform X3 [Alosa sapidissima]|uniref:uncharacterized protein LOC121683545 isoform X3 n=1 Tax=Alosa sapidissima TaxID=34773 RepID=UPI001C09A342|nr:uncharacterized protein LOC121683545 isoform X3 [Alosa sapidissima]
MANVDTAERRVQEVGAPGELKERLKSHVRAFRVRRKPYWVPQRGWGQNNMNDMNTEDTQARKDLRPTEAASEKVNVENTLVEEDLQPDEPVLQPAEPASWVMGYGQMWREMTEQDGPVLCSNVPIIHSGSGSRDHFPAEWALDHLMEEQRASANKEGPVSERANMEETEAKEDVQPGWVVAYGQMWREMTEQDGPVLCSNMPIIYWWLGFVNVDRLVEHGEQDRSLWTAKRHLLSSNIYCPSTAQMPFNWPTLYYIIITLLLLLLL